MYSLFIVSFYLLVGTILFCFFVRMFALVSLLLSHFLEGREVLGVFYESICLFGVSCCFFVLFFVSLGVRGGWPGGGTSPPIR